MVNFIQRRIRNLFRKRIVQEDKEARLIDFIADILKKALEEKGYLKDIEKEEIKKLINIPNSVDNGDYSFPCFAFAKQLKYQPHELALDIRENIGDVFSIHFKDVQVSGAYINFFVDRRNLAKETLWDVIYQREEYGKGNDGKKNLFGSKKIVIDFSYSYIGEPFSIDHLRAIIIGNSLANICESQGFKTIKINYLRSGGINLGKLIFGFQKYGNEEELGKNPIEHLSYVYGKVTKKYDKSSEEWLKKLEERDKKAVILWRAFKELSLESFEGLNRLLGIKFDEYSGEFESMKQVKILIDKLDEMKLMKKRKGSFSVDLRKYKLGFCEIKDKYGKTTLVARDVSEAIRRYGKYKFSRIIYGTNKDEFHLKQVIKVLELMEYDWAKSCSIIKYGIYLNKNRKRIKIRKKDITYVEDMLKENVISLIRAHSKDLKFSRKRLQENAFDFVIGSLFYDSLRNNLVEDVVIDKKLFSDEKNIFKHIKNSYEKASFILDNAGETGDFRIYDLESREMELIKDLVNFQKTVREACNTSNPSIIARYCYNLVQSFNRFIDACPLDNEETASLRLAAIESFRQVLRNSMKLLGIKI